MIALRAAALAAFLFVPGWLAVSLIRGGLREGERLFLAFMAGTGLAALGAQAIALASAYNLPRLLLLAGAVSSLLALAARRRSLRLTGAGGRGLLVALAAVVIFFLLFAPPGRIVFGWSDVGIYPNIAARIEREGGIHMNLPTVREVGAERRAMVYEINREPSLPYQGMENKAFYITDFETGRVVPQFYYLWPALMAVFASFLGLENMFWAVTAMGVLALWGMYLLASRLLGRRWGVAAALLTAVSPLMLYFARYTTSEIMNMALFVAASLALTAYLQADIKADRRSLAVTAAFIFTLGFLCRVDFVFVLPPLALFYLAKRVLSGLDAPDWWFCGILLAGLGLSLAAGALSSGPYFHVSWRSSMHRWAWLFRFPGLLLPLFFAAAFVFAASFRSAARRLLDFRRACSALLFAVLAAVFIYLFFIRSQGVSPSMTYGGISAIVGPSYAQETLQRWAWYFSFIGVLLIYAGYALWFSRARHYAELPVVMIGLAFTLIFSWNLYNTPLHILTMRRLVPVVLPAAVLVVTALLRSLADGLTGIAGEKMWARLAGSVAAGALMLYLVAFAANASIPIMGLREGGNQLELCADIADRAGDDGLVVMDFHAGDLFGAPLRCFYGVESVWLMGNENLTEPELEKLLDDLGFASRPLYLLWRPAMSGDSVETTGGLALEAAGEFAWREEALESSFVRRPRGRVLYDEDMRLYVFVEAGEDGGGI